jgi:PAS domain S-box-containing protein
MARPLRDIFNDAVRRYRSQGGAGIVQTRLAVSVFFVLPLVAFTPVFADRATVVMATAAYLALTLPLLRVSVDDFKKVTIRILPDLLDLLMISVIVTTTGGLESAWFPFYLFPLMSASRYLSPRRTAGMAVFAGASYAVACWLAKDFPLGDYSFWLRVFVLGGVALTAASLARGRRYFQNLVYESPDPIIVLDRHGRIQAFNKECEKIWQVREVDVLGISVKPFYATDEEARQVGHALEVASPLYTIHDFETRIKDSKGTIIPIRLSATRLMEDGRLLGSIGVFKDQRARRRMEEERLVHEKLAGIGLLAQTFGHAIKNDLAAIQTSLGGLEASARSNEEIHAAYTAIKSSTAAAHQKVQNMLIAAKADPAKRGVVSLKTLLDEFEADVRYRASVGRVKVVVSHPDDDLPVYADAEHLPQVLANLFVNSVDAIKAARAGRKKRQTGNIFIDARTEDGFIVLTWRDDGVGMSEAEAAQAFTPLFTTKKNGSGLGLSITRDIVENHGGSIAVEPQSTGVQFIVRLPLRDGGSREVAPS